MKILLISLSGVGIAFLVYFFIIALMSKQGHAPGLVAGTLAACPQKPNCICSERADDINHFIKPIPIKPASAPLTELKQIILSMGGTIHSETNNYLAATFSSSLFGFIDDVEIRIDLSLQQIHIRSASRVGHSDLGVNLKRVSTIQQRYLE